MSSNLTIGRLALLSQLHERLCEQRLWPLLPVEWVPCERDKRFEHGLDPHTDSCVTLILSRFAVWVSLPVLCVRVASRFQALTYHQALPTRPAYPNPKLTIHRHLRPSLPFRIAAALNRLRQLNVKFVGPSGMYHCTWAALNPPITWFAQISTVFPSAALRQGSDDYLLSAIPLKSFASISCHLPIATCTYRTKYAAFYLGIFFIANSDSSVTSEI